jgi:hypothetical protein
MRFENTNGRQIHLLYHKAENVICY